MSSPTYYCSNCGNFGALNKHGRCSTCDSDAVYPTPEPPTDLSKVLAVMAQPRALTPYAQLVARKRDESLMHWAGRFLRAWIN